MGMAGGLRRPFTRLSDRFGVGAAGIGDLQFLAAREVTSDFLPPDGRAVYQADYPGLRDVMKEYLEGDTLTWVQDAASANSGINQNATVKAFCVGADGLLYGAVSSASLTIHTLASDGSISATTTSEESNGHLLKSCAACGSYIALGTNQGNVRLYDTRTKVWLSTVHIYDTSGNSLLVEAIDDRYVAAFPIETYRAAFHIIDTQKNEIVVTCPLPSNRNYRVWDVKRYKTFLLVSCFSNSGFTDVIVVAKGGTSAAPTFGTVSGVTPRADVGVTLQLFASEASKCFFYANGENDTAIHRVNISDAGAISTISQTPSRTPSNFNEAVYDEFTDTLITCRYVSGSGYYVQRARGKIAKLLDGTLAATDFENVSTPDRENRVVSGLFMNASRWFAMSRLASGGATRTIRAGTDANARRIHKLPLLTLGNAERLDGRTPYVRVK